MIAVVPFPQRCGDYYRILPIGVWLRDVADQTLTNSDGYGFFATDAGYSDQYVDCAIPNPPDWATQVYWKDDPPPAREPNEPFPSMGFWG